MYRLTTLVLATLASFAVTGCDDSTGITAADIACPPTQTLTYANYGQAVITADCLGCHATRERPHLTSQAELRSATSQIIDAAVFRASMPVDGSMTNDERIQLGQWLTCGAP